MEVTRKVNERDNFFKRSAKRNGLNRQRAAHECAVGRVSSTHFHESKVIAYVTMSRARVRDRSCVEAQTRREAESRIIDHDGKRGKTSSRAEELDAGFATKRKIRDK